MPNKLKPQQEERQSHTSSLLAKTSSPYLKSELPPLVKYVEPEPEEENSQNLIVTGSRNIVKSEFLEGEGLTEKADQQPNIWMGSVDPKKNSSPELSDFHKVPPLSKWQAHIKQKYRKRAHEDSKFDQSPLENKNNDLIESIGNIQEASESLRQSRVENQGIEELNSWILDGVSVGESPSREENPFRKVNPFSLAENSLYAKKQPLFEEEQDADQQQLDTTKRSSHPFFGQKENSSPSDFKQGKKQDLRQTSMQIYSHFFKQNTNKGLTSHPINTNSRIFIRQGERQQEQFSTSSLLSKKDRLLASYTARNQNVKYQGTVSERIMVKGEQSRLRQLEQSYAQEKVTGDASFIGEKSASELLAAVLNQPSKAKIYLKYLQCTIAKLEGADSKGQETVGVNLRSVQNYEILSCLLIKVLEISDRNVKKNQSKQITDSLLNMFIKKESSEAAKLTPEITRSSSNGKIKIDFNPYLRNQSKMLSERIAFLKKAVEEKKKQTELVKLSYDEIINDYAQSIQNVAKKKSSTERNSVAGGNNHEGNHFGDIMNTSVEANSHQTLTTDRPQEKLLLDIGRVSRGSLEFDKIHRKATFGKAPSSIRNSVPGTENV